MKKIFLILIITIGIFLTYPTLVNGVDEIGAKYFDGINDYILLSTGINSIQMTVEFKIKRKEIIDLAEPEFRLFVGETTLAGGCDWTISMNYTVGDWNKDKIYMAWNALGGRGGWHGFEADTALNTLAPMDEWTHFAFVRGGTGLPSEGKIYVNGKLIAVTDFGTVVPTLIAAGEIVQIGGNSIHSVGFLEAEFDDVRVWNRELSGAEIESLVDLSIPGDMPGLLINLRMDEKTGVPKNYATGFFNSVTGGSAITGTLSVDNAHGKVIIGN